MLPSPNIKKRRGANPSRPQTAPGGLHLQGAPFICPVPPRLGWLGSMAIVVTHFLTGVPRCIWNKIQTRGEEGPTPEGSKQRGQEGSGQCLGDQDKASATCHTSQQRDLVPTSKLLQSHRGELQGWGRGRQLVLYEFHLPRKSPRVT